MRFNLEQTGKVLPQHLFSMDRCDTDLVSDYSEHYMCKFSKIGCPCTQKCWGHLSKYQLPPPPTHTHATLKLLGRCELVYSCSVHVKNIVPPKTNKQTKFNTEHTIAFVSACPVRCTSPHRLAASVHMAELEISLCAMTVVSSSKASPVLRFSICKSRNWWD